MEDKVIINIGRQYGSGGRRVAEALSAKLGISVFNYEIINEAARKSGIRADLFERREEKKRFFSLFSDSFINDETIFNIQSEVIREIAEKQSAIFVGRASDYVLRDMDCLDVFLSCPLELRKFFIARRRSVTEEEAVEIIKKVDKERESYYNFFTFGNWGLASNYDLCLDTSVLGIDGTADLIIEFGKRRGYIK